MTDSSGEAIRRAAELAIEFVDAEQVTPVKPYREASGLKRELALGVGAQGMPLDAVFEQLRSVLDATPSTSSRMFFNQLFSGRDPAATAGEILASVLNNSMYTYKAAGAQILIEGELIRAMSEKVGYDVAEGLFTPGGSLSNLAAMVAARNEFDDRCRETGVSGLPRLLVYASSESHYSIKKNAGLIGLGRENVRPVPTDEDGRMLPGELRRMLREDAESGARPLMVVATSGTTVMGAFDPLREIREVADEFDIWMHVDGAFGGSVLMSQTHRALLDGSELADSFTWDAHKMMGVPLMCSVCLFRHPGRARAHFDEHADYLFQQDNDELNPGTRSLQCGRRNDALKLWAAWKHKGDDGYQARIDRLFELARYAADVVRNDPDMTLSVEPQSINICFEVNGKASDQICDVLDKRGMAKVGHGIVNGRRIVRLVCASPELTERELDTFFDMVRNVASGLPAGDNSVAVTADA